MFADTLQITVTLSSTQSDSCDIPHGVFVSLQVDSLGTYEPGAYVQDFIYNSHQQIFLSARRSKMLNPGPLCLKPRHMLLLFQLALSEFRKASLVVAFTITTLLWSCIKEPLFWCYIQRRYARTPSRPIIWDC
ncbi:Hypothetical_protein [Hexamita inflata]|uniref:Hypothetical_protein n=1 Tax=Hexamita inflata TaxID=28002 RepID=A0AA86RSP6_9EUKA|nr:Hypothetical protein HINF_LOCUS64944 [Hexamita inflata]